MEDLVYGGDLAKWTALANTLKARYYLHTAEQLGTPAYAAALAAAANGIADPTGDYLAYHSSASTESNLYFQFTTQWPDYLSAGKGIARSAAKHRRCPAERVLRSQRCRQLRGR